MTSIHRSALVRHSAQHMFALVNDVAAYPRRFDWCEAAEVIERGDDWLVARLTVRAAGFPVAFATRNVLDPPHRIALSLTEGPFRSLRGAWTFTTLGDDACKVALDLEFEAAGPLLGPALTLGFQRVADRMVDDFCRAARVATADA